MAWTTYIPNTNWDSTTVYIKETENVKSSGLLITALSDPHYKAFLSC